jgi:outer membrane protein TolC
MRALLVLLTLCGPAFAQQTLTLEDAIRIARSHHPTVQAQRGQVMATRARKEQALAALLPFVTGTFGYEPQTPNLPITPAISRELVSNSGNVPVFDTSGMPVVVSCRSPGVGNCARLSNVPVDWTLQTFWTAQLGISWSLWDWGRSLYGWKSANASSLAAQVGLRTAQRNVVLDVKLAFFGAIAADAQVQVAQEAVRTYRAHVEQTKAFHDTGLRTGIDVATAESAAASVLIVLARSLAAQAAARAQLAVALGEDSWRDYRLVSDPNAFEVQHTDERRLATSTDALTGAALEQRTEPVQVRLQERSLLASARSARGQYLPQLSLSLGPSLAGTDLGSATGNFSVALFLGYPAGGMSPVLVHGQAREADGLLLATQAQERATLDSIRQETIDARALLTSARDGLLATRALVEAAARQRALAEGRYQTGVGNVIELYDALLTDLNARFQMVQAQLDLASSRARLQHALGEDG